MRAKTPKKQKKIRGEGNPISDFFAMIKRKVSDFFYDISVGIHKKISKTSNKNKQKTMSTKRRNEAIFFTCLVAYPMLQFLVFYVAVNINSILLAFQDYNVETAKYSYLGFANLFDNFKDFINDMQGTQSMITATKNSIVLYACTLFIALPLNLIFSYFMYKKIPGTGFFRVILFLPQIISALVVSLMFRYFVECGVANIIKDNLLLNKATGFGTMIFYNIWASFGTQILVYTSAMSKIDDSIVEYSQLEGVTPLQEFWCITLPLIFPTITIFLVAGVAALFTNQAGLYNFFGASAHEHLHTLGYVFFVKVAKSSEANYAQYPYASAAGLLFTLVATPITMLVKWALEKYGPSVE